MYFIYTGQLTISQVTDFDTVTCSASAANSGDHNEDSHKIDSMEAFV